MPSGEDPRTIRSIAVTAEDVVTALEATHRGAPTVLRVTPPFSGRMRARIHRGETDYDRDPAPVHVDPRELVADPPPFPDPDDTEDRLRSDPDVEYSRERHRERHVRRLREWREAVRESIVETVDLSLSDGTHRVDVVDLG